MTRKRSGGDFDYDAGGVGYAQQRRADPRIATFIHGALADARTIVNVGAGSGSYEPEDRYVLAVEPSQAMRSQRPSHLGMAIRGFADALPLDDSSVDAAMAIWTVHQWPNLRAGLTELRRVAKGPVVIVAGDGPILANWWLNDYAPELIAVEQRRYPPIETIAQVLGGNVTVKTIPIPLDCIDGMTEAFYGRPERLLDPRVRRAQSSWSFLDPGVELRFETTLGNDLASGRWDERYGSWRNRQNYEGSLRLIVSRPS